MKCRLRGRLPFDAEKDEDIKKAIISGTPDYNNSNFLNLSYNVREEGVSHVVSRCNQGFVAEESGYAFIGR